MATAEIEMGEGLLVVPDVHGRRFWKGVEREPGKIVFLGDYLDPYPEFRVSPTEAIENFKDIIEFKKSRMDDVVLLLGNHDFGKYIYGSMGGCRTDYDNLAEIAGLFGANRELFSIGCYAETSGMTYTFTHAGLSRRWASACKEHFRDVDDPRAVIDGLSRMYKEAHPDLPAILEMCSWIRGGWDPAGSVVWCDVRELNPDVPEWEGCFEVFAHTRMKKPAVCKAFACCDCGEVLRLTPSGSFEYLNGDGVEANPL